MRGGARGRDGDVTLQIASGGSAGRWQSAGRWVGAIKQRRVWQCVCVWGGGGGGGGWCGEGGGGGVGWSGLMEVEVS